MEQIRMELWCSVYKMYAISNIWEASDFANKALYEFDKQFNTSD